MTDELWPSITLITSHKPAMDCLDALKNQPEHRC
jgi:hypothetical protein